MTDPARPRPVPGPVQHAAEPGAEPPAPAPALDDMARRDMARRPVAEHVAVYEAELERLRRDLSTIDQL